MDAKTFKQAKARLLKGKEVHESCHAEPFAEIEEYKREAEGDRQETEQYRRKLEKAEMDLQASTCEREYEVQLIRQYDAVMSQRKQELARNTAHENKLRAEIERAIRDAAGVKDKTKQQVERASHILQRITFSDKSLNGGQSSRELRQAISNASTEATELKATLEKTLEKKRNLEAELKKVPFHDVSYETKKRLLHELAEDQKVMRKRLMELMMENRALQMGIGPSQ
ncbi:hypothetical protein AAVH_04045 [Aphelenchoides avenae]|nr:hypothetical protein AAVH_04045 [Aphelenchus avenae]